MLTEQEERAMATAVLLAQQGAGFAAKPEDVPVCESLVKRDYLERVKGEERGYALSKAFAAALGINAARKAEQAAMN